MSISQGLHPFRIFENYSHDFLCAISNRNDGNMSFECSDSDELVSSNRKAFAHKAGIPTERVALVNSAGDRRIIEVGWQDAGRSRLQGDIAICTRPNTFLCKLVSDSLCLILMDPVRRVVALAHASYHGVDERIPSKAARTLIDDYRCRPGNIRVAFPPYLHSPHCLRKDLTFSRNHAETWKNFYTALDFPTGQYRIAFAKVAHDQLEREGILHSNIEVSPIDTYGDPIGPYFSTQQSADNPEVPNGRFAVIAGFR